MASLWIELCLNVLCGRLMRRITRLARPHVCLSVNQSVCPVQTANSKQNAHTMVKPVYCRRLRPLQLDGRLHTCRHWAPTSLFFFCRASTGGK